MKKTIYSFVTAALFLGVVACGGQNENNTIDEAAEATEEVFEDIEDAADEAYDNVEDAVEDLDEAIEEELSNDGE